MIRNFSLLVGVFVSINLTGQSDASIQLWLDYNHKEFITPDFTLGGEAGFRTDISSSDWYTLYIRPRVSYSTNSTFTLGGGVGIYYKWNSSLVNNSELRFDQQVTAKWPRYNKFHFENRFRLEERYFHYEDSPELKIPDIWQTRARYRLMVQSGALQITEKIKGVYFLLAGETYLPLEIDQPGPLTIKQQIIFGFGQRLLEGRRYEVDLMWEHTFNDKSEKPNPFMIRLRYYIQKNKFK